MFKLWQHSIQSRIVILLVGLTAGVLLVVNLVMAKTIIRSEIEDAGNHLQIQALMAASLLQDPVTDRNARKGSPANSSYYYKRDIEAEKKDGKDHNDKKDHRLEEGKIKLDKINAHKPLESQLQDIAKQLDSDILLCDPDGNYLAGAGEPLDHDDLKRVAKGYSWHKAYLTTIVATAPIHKEQKLIGSIRLTTTKHKVSSRTGKLIKKLSITSTSALFIAWLLAIAFSRHLIKPLKLLEQSAKRAAKGDWDTPLELTGQDEISSLAKAFVDMLSALKIMIEQQKNFVNHASHELRTPLTRMKLRTEALTHGAINDPEVNERFVLELDQEVDRMTNLTNRLLQLGRADGATGSKVVDPERQIKDIVARLHPLCLESKVALKLSITPPLEPINLSEEELDSILTNLVENALKHTPEKGTISITAQSLSSSLCLTVSDSGCGIAAEHLPHIFNRFYRVDKARSSQGVGLGLSLVKAILDAYSGAISAESKVGKGTKFTLNIPFIKASPTPNSSKENNHDL